MHPWDEAKRHACYPVWMLIKPNGIWHSQKRPCCSLRQQRSQFWCGLWQTLHSMYFLCMISPSHLWYLFGLQMCIILPQLLCLRIDFFNLFHPFFLRGGRRGSMGLYHCLRFSFWSLGELHNHLGFGPASSQHIYRESMLYLSYLIGLFMYNH